MDPPPPWRLRRPGLGACVGAWALCWSLWAAPSLGTLRRLRRAWPSRHRLPSLSRSEEIHRGRAGESKGIDGHIGGRMWEIASLFMFIPEKYKFKVSFTHRSCLFKQSSWGTWSVFVGKNDDHPRDSGVATSALECHEKNVGFTTEISASYEVHWFSLLQNADSHDGQTWKANQLSLDWFQRNFTGNPLYLMVKILVSC